MSNAVRVWRALWMVMIVVVAGGAPEAVRAAVGGLNSTAAHNDSSPEWEKLRQHFFQKRAIAADAASQVRLIVPLRAAYGASVPVKVVSRLPQRSDLYVKKMYLFVDKNPSPLAAQLDLTTDLVPLRLTPDQAVPLALLVSEAAWATLPVATTSGCAAWPRTLCGPTAPKKA